RQARLRRAPLVQSEMRVKAPNGSVEPADLFLGHHALDVFGLALDTVARASVRLDRQAGDDGIDAALLDAGAALRPLQLVVDIVIDRVIVRHRAVFPVKEELLVTTVPQSNKLREQCAKCQLPQGVVAK